MKGGTGGGLGVNGSIGNVCGIVTPTVAGYLMDVRVKSEGMCCDLHDV